MKSAKRYNAHLEHVPSDENDLIVAGIIQKGPIQWAKLLRRDV